MRAVGKDITLIFLNVQIATQSSHTVWPLEVNFSPYSATNNGKPNRGLKK